MKVIINARIYDYQNYIENGYVIFDKQIKEVGEMKNYKPVKDADEEDEDF